VYERNEFFKKIDEGLQGDCSITVKQIFALANTMYFPAFYLEGPITSVDCCFAPPNKDEMLDVWQKYCEDRYKPVGVMDACMQAGRGLTNGQLSNVLDGFN